MTRTQAEATAAKPQASDEPGRSGKKRGTKARVLIVDEDEINVEVLQKLLRDEYELATARNGQEGLEKTEASGPDVVLLGIMVPGIDGYETCRRIKSHPAGNTPQVLLVSAKASTPERLKGYEASADGFVVKPFDHDELLAKVRVQARLRNALTELRSVHAEIQEHNEQLDALVQQRTAELMVANKSLRGEISERKQREADLSESEDRFRQIAENSEQVFWLMDWKKGELLYVSPSYEKLYGRSCQSLYEDRRSWVEAIHPEDRARVQETFARKGKQGECIEEEYRIVLPNGGLRWIRARSIPVRNETGEVHRWVGVAEDITERKRAEEELEEHRVFQEAVLECIAEGIVACDQEGTLVYFNPATREFHGLPVEPIPPEEWASHYDLYEADGKTPHERIPLFGSGSVW